MSEPDERTTTADIADTSRREPADDADAPVAREGEAAEDRRTAATGDDQLTPLFQEGEREELQTRWETLQTRFVDDPSTTVEQADELVADLMQRLAESFAEERRSLESQWSSGDDVSTEDLRIALQRYRSFFERLLSA